MHIKNFVVLSFRAVLGTAIKIDSKVTIKLMEPVDGDHTVK